MLRTPYGKTGERTMKACRGFAAHGFVAVAMDVRGRGDSDGRFTPYVNEGKDGYDSIEWAAKEPWSTGKVGTFGGSYLGRVQWLAAALKPPHLVTMVPLVTPSDPFVETPTGLPGPLDLAWQNYVSGRMNQADDAMDWLTIARHLPILTMDEAAGRSMPTWRAMVSHPQLDAFWEGLRYQDKFERIELPVLHISGWYDDEQIGTPLNFAGMTTKGPASVRAKQRLLMGPWPHRPNTTTKLGDVEFGPSALIDLDGYVNRWFDAYLAGKDDGITREPGARLFVMGDNRWVNEEAWPIPRTQWTKFYLRSGGRANSRFGDGVLAREALPGAEPPDHYRYDPADPVPFLTEPSFAQVGGPDDYRSVERRDDVLVYTTPPLAEDVVVCGPVKAELWASSSAPDTDFTAKLLDVWPNGFAQRLCDGMVRARFKDGMDKPALVPKNTQAMYAFAMWNTCQAFKVGHAIRVEVASSAFPKYDRNPNTGEALGQTTTLAIADQTILHDREHASAVVLPIVERAPDTPR
jgi:putative CocE/NonD family hydrolase